MSMKSIYSLILLVSGLVSYGFLHASSVVQDPRTSTKTATERKLPAEAFFVDQNWDFNYSFPGPPYGLSPVKGSFRFAFNEGQIAGYEDGIRGPRLVLLGTLKQNAPRQIDWRINFGAVGSEDGPSGGQGIWDCAKHTRFGHWIPTSLSISSDKQTISFEYPILESGLKGGKQEHCREVSVLYHIIRKHELF
jgi:hypothetical protein